MPQSHGGLQPGVGVQVVGQGTLAEQAHHSQVGDGVAVAAARGLAVPTRGLFEIHCDPAAGVVGQANQRLRAQASGFRGAQEDRKASASLEQPSARFRSVMG